MSLISLSPYFARRPFDDGGDTSLHRGRGDAEAAAGSVANAARLARQFDAVLICANVEAGNYVVSEHPDGSVESRPIDPDQRIGITLSSTAAWPTCRSVAVRRACGSSSGSWPAISLMPSVDSPRFSTPK